ncbi:MAG: GH39 family glycosyl hydrolase [Mobilitalea sp.]
MDNRSILSFSNEGYIRCTVEQTSKHEQQWLADTRIYFVLSGYLNLRIGARSYLLKSDDIAIINKGELFSVTDGTGITAIYDLDISHVAHKYPNLWFNSNPSSAEDNSITFVLKEFLARFIKFNLDIEQDKTYLNRSLYYAIIHHMVSFFLVSKPDGSESDPELLDRFEQIAKYIDNNYHQPLMLIELSSHFYLSVPYMSKMFKRYFGMTFSDYLTNIRLQSSLSELQRGEQTVEVISERFGFPSSRSYISFFKKKYDITPGEYRKRFSYQNGSDLRLYSDGLEVSRSHELELLTKYLENPVVTRSISSSLPLNLSEIPECNIKESRSSFPHYYQKLTSIGCAYDILSAENQVILRALQSEIGFEYIIFHGLFDDDMMVYGESKSGEPETNFGYIDMAFDFLLSIGLKPFVELSYMPRLLARVDAHFTNLDSSCISLPNDVNKWNVLVQNFIRHLNSRYGYKRVTEWPIALWNAPDSSDSIFGLGDAENYFDFYLQTYRTVMQCNPDICFCGPSCLTETAESGSYYGDFIKLCKQHDCMPAMLQYHFYPMRTKLLQSGNSRTELHLSYRLSPDALRESISKVVSRVAQWTDTKPKIFVTEWNASISHRELLSDTAFQAAYIVKNVLENHKGIDALCYWTLSDSISEVKQVSKLYHGGLGLFTYNGIKKASYQAFRLLSRLGNTKLDSGEGYFITRSDGGIQLMLYNYQHYSQLYADGELFDMTFLNRYTPFLNPTRKKFSLSLNGFEEGQYIITETIINPSCGSSFDKWVELGALPLNGQEDYDYLQSMSLPQMNKHVVQINGGDISLSHTLEPHEVRLIEISYSYESQYCP